MLHSLKEIKFCCWLEMLFTWNKFIDVTWFFENQWTFEYCIQISKDLVTISKLIFKDFHPVPNTCMWCGIRAVVCWWLYELHEFENSYSKTYQRRSDGLPKRTIYWRKYYTDRQYHTLCSRSASPWMLLFIDFEKALDSLKWSFVNRTLESFGV